MLPLSTHISRYLDDRLTVIALANLVFYVPLRDFYQRFVTTRKATTPTKFYEVAAQAPGFIECGQRPPRWTASVSSRTQLPRRR